MQKFCFTPSEGMFGIFFHYFNPIFSFSAVAWRPISNTISYSFFNISVLIGLIIWAGVFYPSPAHAYNNENYFLRQISYNDVHILQKSSIDSLFNLSPQLDLPPVRELEIEIGHPVDSMLGALEYKLIGFDDNWNFSSSPFIRYTNLPGRQYELRIRQTKGSGKSKRFVFFSAQPESKSIREKWWFQPLLTFCLLLIPFTIAYFLALDRSRRSLRLEVVRNQIASDLHDDVGANLGAINNLTDLLKKRHEHQEIETSAKIISKIKDYTRDTITNLQDTVWSINPMNDSIEELLGKMKEFAWLMLGAKDIEISYNNQYNDQHPIHLDMQQRHAMFMMFKEIINNVVKHASATQVSIDIHNEKSRLTIAVKDNGIGFDPAELHRGNGLKNFRNRAKENFIDLDLVSAPGSGAQTQMVIHCLG